MNPIHRQRSQPFRAIDLFCGCGGLTVGLIEAGFSVIAAVEVDRKAQETYLLNHPQVRMFDCDIRALDPLSVLDCLAMKPGELDLLAGCPPCQGFSALRTRHKNLLVDDDRNNLITDFWRFIDAMRPKTVMLENVPGVARYARFVEMRQRLRAIGYNTIDRVLDTSDYYVPQRRKRLIMLASRVHTPTLARKARKRITVGQALVRSGMHENTIDGLHAMGGNHSDAVKQIIALIPKDGGSRRDLPPEYQLECHRRCKGFSDVYGRMVWDEVAPTITSGCNSPSKGRFLHPFEDRVISLREAAILQGFPMSYLFVLRHGKQAISSMIGNALPPPFIAAHAKMLAKGLLAKGIASDG